jgi:hypothetical protein
VDTAADTDLDGLFAQEAECKCAAPAAHEVIVVHLAGIETAQGHIVFGKPSDSVACIWGTELGSYGHWDRS